MGDEKHNTSPKTTRARAGVPYTATAADVVRYNKAQLKRAHTNLVNAQQRKDKRAAANIERKIAIYEYTIGLAESYIEATEYINKQIAEAGD